MYQNNDWIIAAEGELGADVTWKPKFKIIEDARNLLIRLEEVDIPWSWDDILTDLEYFAPLKMESFPPLYSEDDFDILEGFETIVTDPESDELPGQSFNQIEISIEGKRIPEILNNFSALTERLISLDIFSEYLLSSTEKKYLLAQVSNHRNDKSTN
ncbi:MAG: hypothetical protein HN936_09000 [Bacteroidetes bacterium]|nr:hypothetical protein [Candidatus Neomarinimicrobiota bacterium]MBT7093372.1 hypothetical protein [Bacteroidota bacterium]MBT7580091.1 hypothetical protein [Candidatus Neomarinimicrobiota bacterium]